MTTTTQRNDLSLRDLERFIKRINRLPERLSGYLDLAFHNPTDAAIPCFEAFNTADAMDELFDILDTAIKLDLRNATVLDGMFYTWMHLDDNGDDIREAK